MDPVQSEGFDCRGGLQIIPWRLRLLFCDWHFESQQCAEPAKDFLDRRSRLRLLRAAIELRNSEAY